MPRRKQGHFQASKRIANNTDRPIGRGRLRKRHNHDSSNKNTVTLSIGSLVTKNGGRGSLRSRSAMLKASQLPTARVPSPPTDHDKPLYQHKKFQRIDCTSPQTINEIPQVNTAEDSGGKSETSITATIKSVAVEEADNGKVSASGDALRSKKNASLEALLKVTELEIIKSSTGNVCLTKNASIGQSKTLPTTSSKKSSTTPNGDVNITKNSRTNNISKIDSENIQSESKAMVDSIDPVDSVGTVDPTGFCEEQDKKKAKNFRHICPYCDHGCAKPSVLRKHIRAHTNERPYPCRLCHFAFKTKSNLYKHRKSRAHTLRVTGSNADPCDLIDSNDESDKISKDGDSEISSDSVPVDSVNNNIIKVASVMPSVSSSKPDSIKDNCYSKIKLENPEVKAEKNQVPISCGQASNPLPFGSISNISQSKDKSNAEKDIMFSSSCSNLAASCPSSPSIHVKTTEGGLRKNSGVITQNSPAKSSSGSGIVYKPKFHFTVDHQIPEEESGPSETHRSDLSSSQIASSLSSDTSLCSRNNVTDKNNQNGSVKDFEGNTGLHNKAVKSDSQDCKDGLMLRMMEGQPNISHPTPSYSPSSSRSVQATEGMPDKIVMESSNDTAELAESTAVKGNELIHESTAVSSASNSAQSQSNPAPTACLPSSSISSSLSSSSTPTTATITTTTKSTLKTPKLSSPEFLEQHISNLIMRNIEIVETQNPFWSRRFVRQSSVASSQNVDAELRARDRRIPRDTDGNQSKLAHALLKPDCESASYRHSTGTQSLPATPSIILSAPPFTGAVLPDTKNQIYSLGVDKNTLIQSATAIVAKEDSALNNSDPSSAVKTLLVSAKHSPNSNSDTANKLTLGESDERRKMDNSVLHPQNPEGSIIKNLLLTKRAAPQNTATLTAAVTTAGGSFPGSVPAPSEKVLIDSVIAVTPETSSIPMYTCLVCRTSFRSPETLLAHQAHYCKRSQKQLTFPLSPSYSSDSDSGRSSKSGMFPTPVTSASTTRPPDVTPKPRGRPKGSKNRPKDVLLIGNNQRILPANKSPHKQQPPVFPQQPVVSVQYPTETQLPADHITGTNIQYKSGGPRGGSSSPADGPILKNHLLSGKLSGDKSPPLKKRKVPEEVLPKDDPHHQRSHSNSSSGSSISTLKSLEELSRHPMRPNSVQLFGGEVQICDGTETKKMKVDTAIQQPTVSGSSSSIMPSQVLPLLGGVSVGGENIPNSAVVVTIAKPVLNSGGTVMQVHDSKACSAPPVCIPVVALGQPLMATGYSSTMLSSEPHSVMSPTASLPTSRFNEVGAIVLSTNIPTSLPINSSGFYSIDISHLQINTVASTLQTKTVGSSNPPMTLLDSTSIISSSKEINSNNPASLKRSSSSKSPSPLVNSSMHINTALHIPQDPQKISLKEVVQANDVEMVPKDNSLFNENNNRPVSKSESSTIPTITIQPASSPKISHETATTTTVTSTVTAAVTTSSDKSKSFLAPPRPTSLAIKSTHSSLVGTTLISPETPRPKKKYEQLYLNGQYYTYLGLKCSTRVYYCCIYRPQPMYVPQSTDSKLSMYSNWQTVPAEPGPFNMSPGAAMALYDSRNKYTSYTMAHPKKMEYILTHSSYWTFRKHKENVASEAEPIITDVEEKKPMIAKEEIPSESISSHSKTPPETTPASAVVSEALVAAANEEAAPPVVKVKNREREPKRVRIFEGGYKSNEEYIYVRGRGRGKYVCEECGIRCKKPSMLKKHIRTHTDVRPFTCKHCNFSFKTKGNLTKHMKSKAHHKKCIELGIDPVPVTIDEAQIDEEALAKQRLEKERGQYIDDDEDTDDEDEDGEEEDDEDEDDEDDDEESLDGESSEERCGSSASRIHSGQFEDAVDDAVNSVISLGHSEDMSSNTSSKFPSEHEIARSLLDLSNHGTADFSASTNINLHSMRSIPSICVGDIHSKMLMSPMMTMESSNVPESRLHHQIPTIEVKEQSDPMSGCGPEELIGSPRVVWASNQKQLRVDVDRPGTSPLLSHDGTVPSEIHFKYHYSSSVTSPSQSDMGSSAPSFQETAVCHLNVPRGESLGVTPYQEPPLIHTGPTQTADNIGGTPGFAEGLRPQVLPPGGSSFPDTLAVSPGPYSPLPMSDKMVSPGRSYAPSTSVNFVKSYDHSPKILQPHHDYPSTPIPPLPSVPESETMETDEGDDYDEPMDLSSKASQRHELSGNYLEDISRIHFQRSTSPMASGSECSLEGRYPPRGTRLAFPVNSPPPANLHSSHSVHSNDDPCDLKSAEIYEAISPPLSEPERPLEEPSGYRPTVPNPTLPQNFPSPNGTRALLPAANPVWDPPAPDTSGNSMLHAYLTDKQVNKSGSKMSAGSKIAFHIAASTASGSHSKLGDFPISSSRMSTSPGAQFNFRQITPASPSTADKCNKPQAEFLLPSGTKQVMYSHRSMDDGKCVCSICNKSFTKPSQLRLHVNIHYFERPFRCDSCAVSFRTKGHLQKHRRSVSHYNKVNMNMTFGTPTTDNPRPFKCGDCKIAFRIHGHLAKHLRSKMHIMKLECLGKLPFGTYAEIERSGVNLNEIDTTDCENSLESLQVMAQRLYDKEPHRHQRWTRERTVSGCSADSGEVVDDSPEGGRYRRLSMSDTGHLSPEYVDLEMIPPPSGVALSDVQNISDVKQEPLELLNSSDNIAAGNYMRAQWETARQTSVESLGQEYEDISDAESEPEATASCSLCRRIFKDIKALQLHLYVDHPDVGGEGTVEGSSTSSGIQDNPSSSLRSRRSVSLSEDSSVILEMRRSAIAASSVTMQMRRNTYSKEGTIGVEMRQGSSLSADALMNMDSGKGPLANKSSLSLELRGESPLPIPVEAQLSGMAENIMDTRKCSSNSFPVRSAQLN